MSLQNVMHRRKFLERSALGATGVLFSSLLLQSCTDHAINPGPNTPLIIPPLTDTNIPWNEDVKTMVASVIEMIPEAGDILGGLVDIFWPSTNEDVWGEIKSQVEALVDQKIAAAVYQQVSEDLQGLNSSVLNYLNEVHHGTGDEIITAWMITRNSFIVALPHFQSAGNELPLLPLFGQFANMYLALLRDMVLSGPWWGRPAADQQQDLTDLKNSINDFYRYTAKVYNDGRANVMRTTKAGSQNIEPFQTINRYDRQMSLTVLDFMDSWYYYDVSLYPNGTTYVSKREIYSDPFGSAPDSGPINITTPAPTQFPTNVTVWSWDRLDGVQLTYPAGCGPGGVTTTPRMGDQGGSNQSPHGGSFNLTPDNPITAVDVLTASYVTTGPYGPFVAGLQFQFHDTSITPIMGSLNGAFNGHGDTGLMAYPGKALSSIHINGVSKHIGSADCIVFGFQYWKPLSETLRAIGILYVKSPKERSSADFAKSFPKLSLSANLITEELKTARKVYWEYIKERVG